MTVTVIFLILGVLSAGLVSLGKSDKIDIKVVKKKI